MKKGPSTRTETRGTGITAREVTVATVRADDHAMARLILDFAGGGRARLARAIVQARAILRGHRLPTNAAPFYVVEVPARNRWRRYRPGGGEVALAPCILPLLVQRLGYAEDSPAGYAARFLRTLHEARLARRFEDWDGFGEARGAADALLTEAGLKRAWERDALRGRKNSEALAAGSARANSARQQARDKVHRAAQEKADELWRRKPSTPASEVARQVKKALCLEEPSDTIRKWLRHPGGKR